MLPRGRSRPAVPMFNEHPIEMGLKGKKLAAVRAWRRTRADVRLQNAFPETSSPVTLDNTIKAIAAFERTLLSANSPVDWKVYPHCHERHCARSRGGAGHDAVLLGPAGLCGVPRRVQPVRARLFTTALPRPRRPFHNTGLYDVDGRGAYPSTDCGLIDQTRRPADMGRFRAPTLRNIAVTARVHARRRQLNLPGGRRGRTTPPAAGRAASSARG